MIRRAALRALCTLIAVADGLLTTEVPSPWRGLNH